MQAAGTLPEDAGPPHRPTSSGPDWYVGLDFRVPDFTVPLDVEELTSLVPESARIKGFFIDGMERIVLPQLSVSRAQLYAGLPRSQYQPFRSYSRAEVMRVEARMAAVVFPTLPLREGLRRLSQQVYPLFLSSVIGRLVLGAVGADVDTVLRLGPKVIGAVTDFGGLEAIKLGQRHWVYRYQHYYSWLDSGDVGIIEGLLQHYGHRPQLRVATDGPFNMTMDIRWD